MDRHVPAYGAGRDRRPLAGRTEKREASTFARNFLGLDKNAPIGIFDSGTGGLTVAKAVKAYLPGEDMIYFGDTAHLPYGDKSAATIQAYAIKITNMLLQRQCKAILMACHSASAAAFELTKAYTGSKALVFNVIDPVVNYLAQSDMPRKVGLIGTLQTVHSGVFETKINQLSTGLTLSSLATPLLAPMIEEGLVQHVISREVISNYLSHKQLRDIEALILGCTHYPMIKEDIKTFYQNRRVELIDCAELVAQHVQKDLAARGLTNPQREGKDVFLVSDYTKPFEKTAQLFFNPSIHLQQYTLWE